MSMPESSHHEARGEQLVGIRFRVNASSDDVVARLLESVRGTDLTLLKVFGDGARVYPFEGRDLARSANASSWRAELSWHSPTLMSGWRLEVFLKRAQIFLDLPGRVRLELRGGQRDPRQEVRGVRHARLWRPSGDARTPLDKQYE